MINNPVYRLSCEIFNCHFILLVNDIPIAYSGNNNSFSTTTSINQWLVAGTNKITFNYWFDETVPYSAESKVNFTLFKIDASDKFSAHKINISQFGIKKGTIIQEKNKLDQLFKIDGGVFKNNLSSLIVVKDLDEVYKSVYDLYDKIHTCFSKKDIISYLSIADEKESDYALVYYQTKEYRTAETQKLLGDILTDPENKLLKHLRKNVIIKLYFEGRLIALEDSEGNPALLFANYTLNTAHFFPLYFGFINKKDELKLIR